MLTSAICLESREKWQQKITIQHISHARQRSIHNSQPHTHLSLVNVVAKNIEFGGFFCFCDTKRKFFKAMKLQQRIKLLRMIHDDSYVGLFKARRRFSCGCYVIAKFIIICQIGMYLSVWPRMAAVWLIYSATLPFAFALMTETYVSDA